jgi:hypothetical protein
MRSLPRALVRIPRASQGLRRLCPWRHGPGFQPARRRANAWSGRRGDAPSCVKAVIFDHPPAESGVTKASAAFAGRCVSTARRSSGPGLCLSYSPADRAEPAASLAVGPRAESERINPGSLPGMVPPRSGCAADGLSRIRPSTKPSCSSRRQRRCRRSANRPAPTYALRSLDRTASGRPPG